MKTSFPGWCRRLSAAAAALGLGCTAGCGQTNGPVPAVSVRVRPPAVAGGFYPASREDLQAEVQKCLRDAKPTEAGGGLRAAVVPHAGYVYSGRCAGSAYRLLKAKQFSRVIILGPSHHAAFAGIALPPLDVSAYRTPLGDVPVAQSVCRELAKTPGFAVMPDVDTREHSIEVELPFLQETLGGGFELVPLICGGISREQIGEFAKALAPFVERSTLVLASSDFTHYGPNYGYLPFDKDVPENLHRWLKDSSGMVAALDIDGFLGHCNQTGDTICGERPILVLMATIKASGIAVKGQVLDTYTSGDVVGDHRNSVSYAAVGFFATDTAAPGSPPAAAGLAKSNETERTHDMKPVIDGAKKEPFNVSEANRKTLLSLARRSIEDHLKGARGKAPEISDP